MVFPQVVRTGGELKRMVEQRDSARIISLSVDGWFIGKKTFKKTYSKEWQLIILFMLLLRSVY